jgi:hypothetical protein
MLTKFFKSSYQKEQAANVHIPTTIPPQQNMNGIENGYMIGVPTINNMVDSVGLSQVPSLSVANWTFDDCEKSKMYNVHNMGKNLNAHSATNIAFEKIKMRIGSCKLFI